MSYLSAKKIYPGNWAEPLGISVVAQNVCCTMHPEGETKHASEHACKNMVQKHSLACESWRSRSFSRPDTLL